MVHFLWLSSGDLLPLAYCWPVATLRTDSPIMLKKIIMPVLLFAQFDSVAAGMKQRVVYFFPGS